MLLFLAAAELLDVCTLDNFGCAARSQPKARTSPSTGGVRNTSGITQKRQARGGAHLGLHRSRWVPQVGTSQPDV